MAFSSSVLAKIPLPCLEMVKLETGLEPLRGIRVRFGLSENAKSWVFMISRATSAEGLTRARSELVKVSDDSFPFQWQCIVSPKRIGDGSSCGGAFMETKFSVNGTGDGSAENIENPGANVLLGAEFMKNCMDMFIVPSKGTETDPRTFNLKNLNISDPLKENNNIGQSVHKGFTFPSDLANEARWRTTLAECSRLRKMKLQTGGRTLTMDLLCGLNVEIPHGTGRFLSTLCP
ncbi:hypothetical protein M8C21_003668, partial [Ambrosia artemisiifolia]